MDFQNYISAIRRRWHYLALSVVIICGLVAYHIKTTKPQAFYQATSRIFVSAQTNSVTAEDIAQMAVANDVAAEVLKTLGLENRMSVGDVLLRLTSDVAGGSNNRGNTVTVTALGETPEAAMALSNAVAHEAKDQALALTNLGTRNQGDYIQTELTKAQRRLQLAQMKLTGFKEQHKDLLVPLDYGDAKRMISELEDQASRAESEVQQNQNRVSQLQRTIGHRSQAKIDVSSAPSSAVVDTLNKTLAEKSVLLMDQKMKYTDENPKVKETQQQIDAIKDRLQQEYKKSFSLENAPTSIEYQFLVGDISRYQAEKRAAEAQKAAIARLAGRAKAQLSQVPELEAQYGQLNTEFLTAQNAYMDLRNRLDQAQLAVRIANKQQEDKQGIGLVDDARVAQPTPGYRLQQPKVKMAIAFFISIILGIGIILFIEGMDTSIRDVDQMEDRYQLPVLGVIPTLREAALKSGSTLVLRDSPGSAFAEPYRIMRANFLALAAQAGARSVVITSTLPGEGKSTTAANFASSLAESHKKVVLVDADLRNPTLHKSFGVRKEPGLSNYLNGECTLADAIFPTTTENLLLVTAGSIPENPSRLLTSARMRELLDALGEMADYVVVDTPPAVAFSDAMELAQIVDSMIVVVGAGSRLESAHFRARTQLANARATLVGTVLNRVQAQDVDSYRYSARYYPRLNGRDGLPNRPPALPNTTGDRPSAPAETAG
ncbi:MAG: polysaccharide biosynthesis tyrosine autokinase [Armatimonadetes bacterium]|nr:polysaccharide biosynthesis tyrosine autokinase [Armatimonadota bacterium]